MATHVKVTGQRVEIKVMVLDPPRGVGRETIHDQPVTTEVRDVRERVVASVFSRVYDDVGEERIGRHVGGIERVLSNQSIGVQVEYHNFGGLQLFAGTKGVVHAGVHDPQPIARVHVDAEYRHDAVGRVRGQTVLFVIRIRYQIWRPIFWF